VKATAFFVESEDLFLGFMVGRVSERFYAAAIPPLERVILRLRLRMPVFIFFSMWAKAARRNCF